MKTILAIVAFATLSMSASATQIAWGSTGALFNDQTQMTTKNGYSTSAYLVYLGDSTATWDSFDIASFVSDTSSAVGAKTANAAGAVSYAKDNYIFTVGDTIPNNAPAKIADGNSNFGVVFISSGTGWGDEQTHYFTSEVTTFSTSGSDYSAATETFTTAPAVAQGSSWQTVPEPSTAALALAGLALLLKRRKA
jgi:hypothetical protein